MIYLSTPCKGFVDIFGILKILLVKFDYHGICCCSLQPSFDWSSEVGILGLRFCVSIVKLHRFGEIYEKIYLFLTKNGLREFNLMKYSLFKCTWG